MPTAFQRAIVVGASSGIGEALARQLTKEGCRVALVARRADVLCALADKLSADAQAPVARAYPHDVRDASGVPALFAEITQELGGLDLIIYAAGVMPRVASDEYPTATDADTVAVNLTGAVAWFNEAAQRMGRAGAGTIVGLSSVAGDRGRRGNTVYAATKAGLNVYLESLYSRLSRRGVRVVTVKPGPTNTPMTKGLKMPGMASPDDVAAQILEAARAGARVAYVPARWKWVMAVLRNVPAPIFRYLPI